MASPFEFNQFQTFLKSALNAKKKKNSTYSLGSFAKATGVSTPYLSRVLNKKRNPSISFVVKVSKYLDLSPEETLYFIRLIELEQAKGEVKVKIAADIAKYRKQSCFLKDDQFHVIADWYHFAILSLAQTRSFQPSASWIAKRLGISELQAKQAFQRLCEQKLLIKEKTSYVVSEQGNVQTPHDVASAAVKENHRQHLRLAENALHREPIEHREFANTSIAMNYADIPKAKKKIRLFLDHFIQEMERKPGHEVFQFNLQFYLLSKKEGAKT